MVKLLQSLAQVAIRTGYQFTISFYEASQQLNRTFRLDFVTVSHHVTNISNKFQIIYYLLNNFM